MHLQPTSRRPTDRPHLATPAGGPPAGRAASGASRQGTASTAKRPNQTPARSTPPLPEMPVSKSAPSRFSTPQKQVDSRTETSFQRPPRPRGLGENRVEKAVVSAFRSAPYRLGLSVGCCCPGLGFSERVVGPDRGVLGPTPHLGRVQIQRISLAIARRPGPGHFGAMLGCGPNMQSAAPVAGRICRAAGRRSVAAGMEYRPLDRSVR